MGEALQEQPIHGQQDESAEPETDAALSEQELSELIEQLCRSKAEEFRLIGYEQVREEEIWNYVSEKYAKSGMPRLHVIVNDILSLKATKFMDWLTMNAFKGKPF
jgi:hypothetical protein